MDLLKGIFNPRPKIEIPEPKEDNDVGSKEMLIIEEAEPQPSPGITLHTVVANQQQIYEMLKIIAANQIEMAKRLHTSHEKEKKDVKRADH